MTCPLEKGVCLSVSSTNRQAESQFGLKGALKGSPHVITSIFHMNMFLRFFARSVLVALLVKLRLALSLSNAAVLLCLCLVSRKAAP